MSDSPLVSVVVPTYNRADLVSRAIQSVVDQTYRDWELLVVDDGSVDNTREVVAKFAKKDSRIKYFYKENGGQGLARNVGIKNAKGGFIALLDSDDEWLPEKLEKQMRCFENNDDADFCCAALLVGKNGRKTSAVINGDITKDVKKFWLSGNGRGAPSSFIFRKNVFEKIGLFDERRELIGLEDNEWGVRGCSLKGVYVDAPLAVYHIHGGQITKTNLIGKRQHLLAGLEYILRKDFSFIAQNGDALSIRYGQLSHVALLTGDNKKSRLYAHKAWEIRKNPKNFILIILSQFPAVYSLVDKLRHAVIRIYK